VALATLLGTPLAGGILMAINGFRLGRLATIRTVLIATTLGTLVVFLLGWLAPEGNGLVSRLLLVLQSWMMYSAVEWLQGPALWQHVAAGGRFESGSRAAGIGLLCALAMLSLLLQGVLIYFGGELIRDHLRGLR
jgi:hypothetical protein